MRHKRMLIIITLFVLMIGSIIFIGSRLMDRDKSQSEDEGTIPTLIDSTLGFDQVEVIGREGFHLIKETEAWHMKESDEPVYQEMAEEAVRRLSDWTGHAVDVEKRNVGLDFPDLTLKVYQEDSSVRLMIGHLNARGDGYYVHHAEQDQTYIIDRESVEGFSFYRMSYLDRRLLEDLDSIVTIQIDNGTEVIELTKDRPFSEAEGRANVTGWYIKSPFKMPHFTAFTPMSDILENLPQLAYQSKTDHLPEDMETGLSDADFFIRFSDGRADKTLVIGSPAAQNSYYAMFEEAREVFTISNETVRIFSKQSQDLHDGFLKLVALDTLAGFEIDSVNSTVQLERKPNTDETVGFTSSNEAVNMADLRRHYTHLAGLRADKRVGDASYDAPKHRLHYAIETDAGIEDVIVEFVDYDDAHYAVFVNGMSDFATDKTKADQAMKDMVDFLYQ